LSALLILALAFGCVGCDGAVEDRQEPGSAPLVFPTSKAEAERRRNPECSQSIAKDVRVPVRFIAIWCDAGRVGFWVPDDLFDLDGLELSLHQIIVAGPDGDRLLTREIDPKWFDRANAEPLGDGLVRIPDGGSQGYDTVLRRPIQPYLYLLRQTGGICQSSNMSAQPRALMVNCWVRAGGFTLIANGPQDEAATILDRLSRISTEIQRKP